jgi:peroxiredoxin
MAVDHRHAAGPLDHRRVRPHQAHGSRAVHDTASPGPTLAGSVACQPVGKRAAHIRSPVCGDQLALYNELRDEFAKHKTMCIGISVDGAWCHAAFRESRGYRLALLSDFEPKGQVARDYNVYRTREGVSERALFVIDEEGVIRWTYVSPIGINPGADGILKALEEMDGSTS